MNIKICVIIYMMALTYTTNKSDTIVLLLHTLQYRYNIYIVHTCIGFGKAKAQEQPRKSTRAAKKRHNSSQEKVQGQPRKRTRTPKKT